MEKILDLDMNYEIIIYPRHGDFEPLIKAKQKDVERIGLHKLPTYKGKTARQVAEQFTRNAKIGDYKKEVKYM